MSAGRYNLLTDLRLQLRKELAETTATSATHVFPETLNSFNGMNHENLFAVKIAPITDRIAMKMTSLGPRGSLRKTMSDVLSGFAVSRF